MLEGQNFPAHPIRPGVTSHFADNNGKVVAKPG